MPSGKPKKSIIYDGVHPRAWNHLNIKYACEDCSLYDSDNNWCTMGHDTTPHLKVEQQKSYELTGKICVCRFLEID